MQKPFMMLMALIILTATAIPSLSGKQLREQQDVTIRRSESAEFNNGRPHAPARPLFCVRVDTDMSLLFVSTMYDVHEVSVCIENLSTGECGQYTFESTETAFLPFSCSPGFWQIRLILDNGAKYVGEFQI